MRGLARVGAHPTVMSPPHEHADWHNAAKLIPAEAPESSPRRRLVAGWVLGAGLAALALAFPEERLLGQQVARAWFFSGSIANVGHLSLSYLVVWITELRPEAAGFVVAALAYGACLPVCLSIARRAEHGLGVSLATSLVVLLSPVAWVAGTTPGPAALGMLATLVLLRVVWLSDRPAFFASAASWGIAVWCAPVSVWLLPAVIWAVWDADRGTRRGQLTAAAAAILGGVWLWIFAPLTPSFLREAIFGGSAGWGQIVAWGMGLLPGLGLAALATASLFLLRRHESEARPPRWLLLWCLLPLAAVALGGSPTWEIPYLWILPPALIGGLDLLSRLEERVVARFSLAAVVVQGTILLGVLAIFSSTDPLTEWRKSASEILDPEDLVFTTRADHAYLLRERWGLETQRVDEADPSDTEPWLELARAAADGRRRVVFDCDVEEGRWTQFEELIEELEAEGPLIRLDVER